MNPIRHHNQCLAFCVLAALSIPSQIVFAQVDDESVQALARARRTYETEVQSVREDIQKSIDKKKDMASKAKDNIEAIANAKEEEGAFKATGELPEFSQAVSCQKRYLSARDKLSTAYGKAMLGIKDQALGKSVDAEAEKFASQTDLVPWGGNLVENVAAETRTLAAGSEPLSVEIGVKGEFRLEVVAKRTRDSGTMFIAFPCTDGKQLELPTVADEKGIVRVLLSVYEEIVSADLGVIRPIDLNKSNASENRTIKLRSEGGSILIEMVRVKPVIEGKPQALAETPKRPKEATEPQRPTTPQAQLHRGDKFVGTLYGQSAGERVANAEIRSIDGNIVVVRVKDHLATYDWRLIVKGSKFTVDALLPVSQGASKMTALKTRDSFIGGGKIQWRGSWQWQNKGAGAGNISAWLDLKLAN